MKMLNIYYETSVKVLSKITNYTLLLVADRVHTEHLCTLRSYKTF
jgi:hypothetical protein